MVSVLPIAKNSIDPHKISKIIKHLTRGGILLYPTDTSYGAGVLINDRDIRSLSLLKNRPEDKKYSVIIPSLTWAKDYLEMDQDQEDIVRKHLPGAYTFILKKKESDETLGIRLPDYPFIQLLVKKLDSPLTATSANVSGQSDAYNLDDLQKGILKQSIILNLNVLVLDGGQLKPGSRSTIVDLTKNPPLVVREGSGQFKNILYSTS